MVLLGASTVFGPLRSASVGARVVVGIVVGFVFYAVNEILAPFTIFYGVPPIVGATLPTSIVLVVAIYLLRKRT
ncbi:MAG: LptF/LptG family permease [Candidatus Onthovivens sp.]|nr:LptF/LptG family permease [Candidatus Onthovivens sp.]